MCSAGTEMLHRFDPKGCLDGYGSSDEKKHRSAKKSVKENEGEKKPFIILFSPLECI